MENKTIRKDRRPANKQFNPVSKIDRILIDIQKKLKHSYAPVSLNELTAFERKRIHSFFDNKPDFETKTYRNEDDFILTIYPIGNLKKEAEQIAKKVLETGESYFWENLGNYERFIIHDHLKSFEGIETISSGEGNDRKLQIKQKQFGRTLKKIMKKIKLF